MDYSKITLLKNKLRNPRKDLAEILKITVTGLDRKINHQYWSVKDIETLSDYFKVPISYFFGEEFSIVSEDPDKYITCKDCIRKEGVIEALKDQLQEKEKKIEQLNREIGGTTPSKAAQVG
jgi:hypothetical protein